MNIGYPARTKTLAGAAALSLAALALGGCQSSGTTQAAGSLAAIQSSQAGRAGQSSQGQSSTAGSGDGSQGSGATTGTGASSAASHGSNSSVAACAEGQLKVTTDSAGAGAGHTGLIVVLTNTGHNSCQVQGYPGASVTDHADKTVVLSADRQLSGYLGGQYPAPSKLVLAPGATASTVLEWLDAPTDGSSPTGANCPGMDQGKLLITPPNTKTAQDFAAPTDLCADFVVHPLVPGGSGRPAS